MLPAIPIILGGAMNLYRAYQVAKFAKVAYSTINDSNLDNVATSKMSKFLNIGKDFISAVDSIALKGTAGAVVKGLSAVSTVDTGISVASKMGEMKEKFSESAGKSLFERLSSLKSVAEIATNNDSKKVTAKI